jgi:hypothetical protein
VTKILDTDIYGYHAEVAKLQGGIGSATRRGKGPQQPFLCAGCGEQVFEVTVGFVFWPGGVDLFLDEPTLPCEDFFNVFLCFCRCARCSQVWQPTDFGKL